MGKRKSFKFEYEMKAESEENIQGTFSGESHSSYQSFNPENSTFNYLSPDTGCGSPLKLVKTNSSPCKPANSCKFKSSISNCATENRITYMTGTKNRSPLNVQDHIVAERKRREKLNQRFITLSQLLPGLKKKDKATVLEGTIKRMKELEERVKTLEEEAARTTIEPMIVLKKSQVSGDDESSSSEDIPDDYVENSLPEIEARISDKDILINIYCENQKGLAVKITDEIEKQKLFISNSWIMPFGNSFLTITVVAQMEEGFSMGVKDLVKNLKKAIVDL
ncbi:Myc-type, basic helix-loop-helix (bHLH) domain [Dillenia turbinata]|uniref:Myc-type, basic helix-loop-helix (BHLH) domain n=1 Tax=Dillenia turbinata TaxID=194707 RepID=A0AAN8UQZ1_9MAGN